MGNRTIGSSLLRRRSLGSARLACRHGVAAALAIGTLWLGMGAAHAENINACPVTITKPGHYNLNKNLVCTTSGNAITIAADNVTLDLKGHFLIGPQTGGASTGVGVYVGAQQNVIVANGTITGFNVGVVLEGSTFSRVTGIAARGDYFGMIVAGGHNNAVSGCDASQSGFFGIYSYSAVLTITNSTANSNLAGIADFGTLTTIQGNTAEFNFNDGIGVHGTQGTIQGNIAEFNRLGFLVAGTGNTIRGNTALGNSGVDLYDQNGNCDSNTWLNNTFVTRDPICIH
jgi:parallel beta-helix repeat protein